MGIQSLKRASLAAGFALVSAEETFEEHVVMYPHLMLTHDPDATAQSDQQKTSARRSIPTVMLSSRPGPAWPAIRLAQYFTWKPTTA
ncbi:MAG: hypothetical protein AAGG99_08450 [Pseudomonadota bacterium]